jgi:Zn-dependent protease with chaperone function
MKPIIKLILIVIPICLLFAAFIYGIWGQYIQPFLSLSTNYLTNVNNFVIVVSVILSLIALITVFSILRGSVSRRNEYKTMPIRQRLQYK